MGIIPATLQNKTHLSILWIKELLLDLCTKDAIQVSEEDNLIMCVYGSYILECGNI